MMLFRPEMIPLIRSGRKTQTRRLVKEGDYALYGSYSDTIQGVVRGNRTLWRVGNTYAVQPGRGKRGVDRILLLAIRRQLLVNITHEDVLAEGVSPERTPTWKLGCLLRFGKLWNSIYKKPGTRFLDDAEVWALTFEPAEADNG